MPLLGSQAMTPEEIDDLLYFTRANEVDDLKQTITDLSGKYGCSERDILVSAVDPDSGNTVLHYCSANGFLDLLKLLLAAANASQNGKGQDRNFVNSINGEGNTPLHWAAYNGHLEVVKTLISDGSADMWIKNAAGHLAIFEAQRADENEVVQYLLEVGGDRVDSAAAQASTEVDVDATQNRESSSANASSDVSMSEK